MKSQCQSVAFGPHHRSHRQILPSRLYASTLRTVSNGSIHQIIDIKSRRRTNTYVAACLPIIRLGVVGLRMRRLFPHLFYIRSTGILAKHDSCRQSRFTSQNGKSFCRTAFIHNCPTPGIKEYTSPRIPYFFVKVTS